MGTSDFAVPALRALQTAGYPVLLVVTQPDRPAGRGLEIKASPVKNEALTLGLALYQPEKIKAPEALETLQKLQPDVIIVAAYGQILPASVLNIPKIACLNIHGSILPNYRGAAPIHYAVMNGETETGVTLMYMNERMDEGDLLLVKKTPVGPEETTGEVHDRLAKLGAEGLLEALELLKRGRAPREPQNHRMASYAPSLKREQCFILWNAKAEEVVNKIRGLAPWPAAETRWKEVSLKVLAAKVESHEPSAHQAGEVLKISREGVAVAAGNGTVILKEIQPQGKRKMSAFDFTLGHTDFKPGIVLS